MLNDGKIRILRGVHAIATGVLETGPAERHACIAAAGFNVADRSRSVDLRNAVLKNGWLCCRERNLNQSAGILAKLLTPHNLYYVKYDMCDDARTQIGQRACPALGANYDAVQSAADASSAAFTARAAVRAPVASKFRNSSSCASSPRLMHASTSPASVYRP